jgi:hypothetical protein
MQNGGRQKMSKFLNASFLGAIIGAIIGALVAGIITANIYKRQLLESQFLQFVDEVDKALVYSNLLKSVDYEKGLKAELELSLNKAWAKAFVVLPDEVFLEIDDLFTRKKIGKEARNRIYYIIRQHLYPNTKIEYDKYMDRLIRIKE